MFMAVTEASSIVAAMAQYDDAARRFLAQRQILARIFARTVRELRGLEPSVIEGLIEGEPEVACGAVGPGEASPRIAGQANQDSVIGEGSVFYDIRTYVNVPSCGDSVRVIINVEAQKKYNPGYEIVTRGIFYAARLISSQLGTEFEHSDYDALKKVYSIWVCTNAPVGLANSIASYRMGGEDLAGHLEVPLSAFDKLEVIVIALNERRPSNDKLLGMLNTAFSKRLNRRDKITALTDEYNLTVSGDVAEGTNIMCNLGEGIYEEGLEEGLERGLRQGREEGREQGREEGLEQGLQRGREQGREECREECREEAAREKARLVVDNLARGLSYEQIAAFLGITVDETCALEAKAND